MRSDKRVALRRINPDPRASDRRSDLSLRDLDPGVERVQEIRIRDLRRGGKNRLATRLENCSDDEKCGVPVCAHCACEYRLTLIPKVLALVRGSDCTVVTLLLHQAVGAELPDVDIGTLHRRLRKRMARAGIEAAIGGTEASYDAGSDSWIVHVHLLVLGDSEVPLKRLKEMSEGDGFDRPMVRQAFRDPVRQASYLQKFATFHRPGAPGRGGKGRAYPLKPAQLALLATWMSRYNFGDFLFLFAFRRRGTRIVPQHS
jgi:hypothetical protein